MRVILQGRRDDDGQVHDAPAGIGLRSGDDAIARPQLDGLDLHPDDGADEVDVTAAQGEQLTQAEPPEAGEQDEGPVPLPASVTAAGSRARPAAVRPIRLVRRVPAS